MGHPSSGIIFTLLDAVNGIHRTKPPRRGLSLRWLARLNLWLASRLAVAKRLLFKRLVHGIYSEY